MRNDQQELPTENASAKTENIPPPSLQVGAPQNSASISYYRTQDSFLQPVSQLPTYPNHFHGLYIPPHMQYYPPAIYFYPPPPPCYAFKYH